VAVQDHDDDFQNMAVGMRDGGIVIIDLILGMEKQFLEKHPAAITSLAFFEEKCLMSGSVDGRVNLCDIEDGKSKKHNKCQNC
jgi:hypothetical protein